MTENKQTEKTANDILAEQLAVLSADIKPKVGKQARERAEDIASGHIRNEKTRLDAEFAAWCAQGLLTKMKPDESKIWHDYKAAVDAMVAHFEAKGQTRSYSSAHHDLTRYSLTFAKFFTGFSSDTDSVKRMVEAADKLPGYAKKKAAHDARLAELDAIMAATKKAIWRTHRERGEITVSGIDIGQTVAAIVKQAIGVPALAAPAIVPDEVIPASA